MDVQVKPVYDMTPTEYNVCMLLTLGPRGRMQPKLRNIYEFRNRDPRWPAAHDRYKRAIVALAQENERILGWALAFPDEWQMGRISAFFYVDPTHRRRGIGTALHAAVTEAYPEAICHPWNEASKAFFMTVETSVTQEVE